MQKLLPAIWLIVLIVGLPQLSETVYTPSLPEIADALNTSDSMVEYTLTIYLFAFAIGTLFWGKISDKLGRKPCLIAGLFVFMIGCVICYLSQSIEMLMLGRFIQGFGGSTGSVLGQAICRDAFHGSAIGKVYSIIGSALSLFPAIGPVIGGFIAQYFEWYNIFIFLLLSAAILVFLVITTLPETHTKESRSRVSFISVLKRMLLDKRVLGFSLIVGEANGILFSYFAEGAFYLMEGLKLSPLHYGFTFVCIAFAAMCGGITSTKLHSKHSSEKIMLYGIMTLLCVTTIFSTIAIVNHYITTIDRITMISISVLCQMSISFSTCIVTSNALALALKDYKDATGTASSLFGFFYYTIISIFTLGMGFFHDGSLLVMPIYFFAIAVLMVIVNYKILKNA